MTPKRIDQFTRELVLNRLAPVGPPERVDSRRLAYASGGARFIIRTANQKTCWPSSRVPDKRLHWTKFDEDVSAIEAHERDAERAGQQMTIVLATYFPDDGEVCCWTIPFRVLRPALGHDALYIREEGGRHVAEIRNEGRPLGGLDLREYLMRFELTASELETVREIQDRED